MDPAGPPLEIDFLFEEEAEVDSGILQSIATMDDSERVFHDTPDDGGKDAAEDSEFVPSPTDGQDDEPVVVDGGDDYDEDMVVLPLSMEQKEAIQKAKECVDMTMYVGPGKTTGSRPPSKVWNFVKLCTVKPNCEDKLARNDANAWVFLSENSEAFVCVLCFADPLLTLRECLHKGSYNVKNRVERDGKVRKATLAAQPGYFQTNHLKKKHKDVFSEKSSVASLPAAKKQKRSPAPNFFLPTPKTAYPDSDITDSHDLQSPLANAGAKPSPYNIYTAANEQITMDGLYDLIVQFSNECNISQRALCERPAFLRILQYVVKNCNTFKRSDPEKLVPTWRKFCEIRQGQYEYLLATTSFYLHEAKACYVSMMGKAVPFVTIQHDIWDSDDNEVLGVTLVFYCPKFKMNCRIPIALVRVISKFAVATVEQTLESLRSVGILKDDLYRSVNDTTNVAVKVGKLLSGSKGTCNMHTLQLIIEHSTGKRTRKHNTKIIDEFPECEEVRKAAKAGASYMTSKKKKSVWKAYAKQMKELGRHFIKIFVPNDTRAAGVVLMYQSLLRSRFNLKKFYADFPDATQVSDDMFVKIAELEAVLYPLSVLIKLIQTDKFGSLSYSFVLCFRTYVHYVINEKWYVADVGAQRENHWSAAAQMPKRDWRGIPDDFTCTGAHTGYEK
jgi:hypothetical protein